MSAQLAPEMQERDAQELEAETPEAQTSDTPASEAPASELIAMLGQPLASGPCGEDPRYSDRFARIKQELEKLSGTDFALVYSLAREILAQESRDLRVLGYLALAATYEQGLKGLVEACQAYHYCLENLWDDCHPQRAPARRAALEWLNTSRFAVFAEAAGDADDAAQVQAVEQALRSLNEAIAKRLPEQPPQFTQLKPWLDQAMSKVRQAQAAASKPAPAAAPTQGGVGAIDSDKALLQATREILSFLRRQGDWSRVIAYSRALRWGAMILPPNEAGQTRVPPLRAPALAAVDSALAQGEWEQALQACEAAFMEPGGQFCLLLQAQAAQAAQQWGKPDVAAMIRQHCQGLLERLPELTELSYDNGEPFADVAALEWLEQLKSNTATASVSPSAASEQWQIAEREARESARESGLAAGLAVLDGVAQSNGRDQARGQLAKSRLCLEHKRGDLALPVLEGLSDRLQENGLIDWAPEFALEVWRALKQAQQSTGKAASAEQNQRLNALKARICRADLSAAVALL